MGIVNVESRTFERMLARFEEFTRRMDALCHTHRIEEPDPWLDNQLPTAEYLKADVADPTRQRVALLYADQSQDLLPDRRCAVVPCGAGSTTQARPEAQKQGINSGSRIVTPVVVSGRISFKTNGKWAMN